MSGATPGHTRRLHKKPCMAVSRNHLLHSKDLRTMLNQPILREVHDKN